MYQNKKTSVFTSDVETVDEIADKAKKRESILKIWENKDDDNVLSFETEHATPAKRNLQVNCIGEKLEPGATF